MMKLITFILLFFSTSILAQSDVSNLIRGGELLLSGLSIIKVAKSEGKSESKLIESICVKNKLVNKVTFRIVGKNEEGDTVKKELVIQKDGKECLFEVSKGIYTYEIELPNKEIFKKGECKFDDDIVITVKDET